MSERRPRRARTPDPIAVERLVMGCPPEHVTIAERRMAYLELRRLRLPASQIAARLGVSARTIERYRRRVLG